KLGLPWLVRCRRRSLHRARHKHAQRVGPRQRCVRKTLWVHPRRQPIQADVCICARVRNTRRSALLSFDRAYKEGEVLERRETDRHHKNRYGPFDVRLRERDQRFWSRAAREYLAAEKHQRRERWNRAWI